MIMAYNKCGKHLLVNFKKTLKKNIQVLLKTIYATWTSMKKKKHNLTKNNSK
jgi:hypothetical protein